jgi:hypothetical protein
MVRGFAKAWWVMIGVIFGTTAVTLFLTVIHKDRFHEQCSVEHDAVRGTSECDAMYVAALLGSLIGCLIGVTMIVSATPLHRCYVCKAGETLLCF